MKFSKYAPISIRNRLAAKSILMPNGCIEWFGGKKQGYGTIELLEKVYVVHRLAYEIHNGPTDDSKMEICHKCNNPSCINPEHLYLGTHADNMRDMSTSGRCGRQKLTLAQVKMIRSCDIPNAKLARTLGVTPSCVCNVRRRVTWRHVA